MWDVGDVEVQNASAIVADEKEAVKQAEGDRGNGEEIHRDDSFLVVAKKGKPALARPSIPRRLFHPAGDRSFLNIKTDHEKLAVDAGSSPRCSRCVGRVTYLSREVARHERKRLPWFYATTPARIWP